MANFYVLHFTYSILYFFSFADKIHSKKYYVFKYNTFTIILYYLNFKVQKATLYLKYCTALAFRQHARACEQPLTFTTNPNDLCNDTKWLLAC